MNYKKYELNSFLNGREDDYKLTNIYLELRKKLNLRKLVKKSTAPLITLINSNSRLDPYFWEIYRLNKDELLILEIHGSGKAIPWVYSLSTKINKKTAGISFLEISLDNPKKGTIKTIEEIIKKYPGGQHKSLQLGKMWIEK